MDETKYIVEYILNNEREWAVWYSTGLATKTWPMGAEAFIKMDQRRKLGEYVFFSVEVIKR